MRKLFIDGIIGIVVLFSCFAVLNSIDWMTVLKVKHSKQVAEERIGKLVLKYYLLDKIEIKNDSIVKVVENTFKELCVHNKISTLSIKLHIVESNEINAFSIPGNQILINMGLIKECDNREQLAAVLAHELAHLELNHITKKMAKEFGISILIATTGSSEATNIIKAITKLLSTTAYDRKIEKDADLLAVEYLKKSDIDPNSLIHFLKKIEDANISWISTHPNTQERIAYINESILKK